MQSTPSTTGGAVTIAPLPPALIPPSQQQDTPQPPLGSSGNSSSMDHLNQIFDAVRQQIHNWGERAKWKIDLVLLENDDAAVPIAAVANPGAHAFSSPDTTLLSTSKQLVPIAPMVPPGTASTTPQLLPQISGPIPPASQPQVSSPSPVQTIPPPVVPMLQGVPILPAGTSPGAPPLQFGFLLDEMMIMQMNNLEEAKQKLREALVRIRALESLVKSQSEQVKAASVRVDKTNLQIDTMRNFFLQREEETSLRYSVETRLLQQDIKALTKKLKEAQAKLETESEWSDSPSSRKLKEAEARYAVETSRFLKERKALKRKLRHSESRSAQKESELEYAQQQLYYVQHGGNPPPPPSQHDQTGPLGYTECDSRFASSSQGYEPPQLQHQPRSGLDNLVLLADQMLSNPSSSFLLPPADIPDGLLAPQTVTKLALDHLSPTPSPIGGGQTAKSPPPSSVNSTHEDKMSVVDAGEVKDVDMIQCDHVRRESGGRDGNVHPNIPGFTSQSSNIVEQEGVQDDFPFKAISSPTTRGSIVSSDPSSRTPSPTQAAAAVMAMDLGRSDLGRSKRSIDSATALLLMPNMVFPRAPPAVEEEREAEEAAVQNMRDMEEEEQGPLSALAIAASLAPMQQTLEKASQPQQRQGTQVLQHPHLLSPQRERSPALQAIAPRPSTPSSSVTLPIQPQPSPIPFPAVAPGRSHTPPLTPPATIRKKPRSPYSKWTPEQDAALRSAVEKHGAKNWELVAQDVPDRTYHQCRQRWIKVLKGGSVTVDSENSGSSPEDNSVDIPREKTPNPRTEQALAALQARYAESSSSSATTSSATLLPSLPSTPNGRQLGVVGTRSTSSAAIVAAVPQTPHQQIFPMYQQATPNTSDALRGPIIFPNAHSTPTPLKHDAAAASPSPQPYASLMSTPPPRAPDFSVSIKQEPSGIPTQTLAPKKRKTRGSLSFGDGYPRSESSGGAVTGEQQHGVVSGLRKKKRAEEKEAGGVGAPGDGEVGPR